VSHVRSWPITDGSTGAVRVRYWVESGRVNGRRARQLMTQSGHSHWAALCVQRSFPIADLFLCTGRTGPFHPFEIQAFPLDLWTGPFEL